MNKLFIPPSINWYESNAVACAPDNTIVYASRNDVIVIEPKPSEEPADIKILPRKHQDRVISVAVNLGWETSRRFIASASDDKTVRAWNLDDKDFDKFHAGHTTRSERLIGAVFAGNDRIVSVSEDGYIIVWRYNSKELNGLSNIFQGKIRVSSISSCPHATWLTAFGFKQGAIAIVDLRGTGRLMYRLFGHENKPVVSLSWCPAPYNIFPSTKKISIQRIKHSKHSDESETKASIDPVTEMANLISQNTQDLNMIDQALNELVTSDQEIIRITHHEREKKLEPRVFTTISDNKATIIQEFKPTDTKLNDVCQAEVQVDLENAEAANESINNTKGKSNIDQSLTAIVETIGQIDKNLSSINEEITHGEGVTSIDQDHVTKITATTTDMYENKPENDFGSHLIKNVTLSSSVCAVDQDSVSILGDGVITSVMPENSANSVQCAENVVSDVQLIHESHSLPLLDVCPTTLADTDETLLDTDQRPLLQGEILNDVSNSDLPNLHQGRKLNVTEDASLNAEKILCLEGTSEVKEDAGGTVISSTSDFLEEQEFTPDEPVREYLLASAVKGGRSIIIWRAGTDGQKQIELPFSTKYKGQKNKKDDKRDDNIWSPLCWLKPKCLLSSSLYHELIEWNFTSVISNKVVPKWRLIHKDHSEVIFNIAAPFRRYDSVEIEDWRDKNLLNVWTFGKDRLILNTCLSSNRETCNLYSTCTGGVNSILSSPLAPNRLAVVSGDGSCRLWDICRPHFQYISMPYLLDRSRVACIAWHPSKDVLFAFGTTEGKVGIMDSSNLAKKQINLVQHFNSPIKHMEWGPLNGDLNNMALYVLSHGKLVIYDTSKSLNEPIETDISGDDIIYCFAWKPDYSICAVGTKIGTVILMSVDLKCLPTLYLEIKCITYLAWHHESAANISSDSNSSNWLAVAGSEIKVYDCSVNVCNGAGEESNLYDKVIASFSEHTAAISHLTWNPHQEGILASASGDGSVLVWNVNSKILVHCCRSINLESINCVVWSPINEEFIITGGKDSTITIWNLSENLPKEKISKRQRKNIVRPKQIKSNNIDESEVDIESTTLINGKVPEPKKLNKNVLAGLAYIQNSTDVEDRNCQKVYDSLFNKPSNNQGENGVENETNQISVTQIFGTKADVNTLLDLEKQLDCKAKYANSNQYIALWQGNLGECIKNAIKEETLTPWHINLAPMVSSNLWQESCAAYAEQLSKSVNKDPFLIASYYLACHKIEQAIDIMCLSNKFREALALAKIRLLDDDPLLVSILERWANYTESNGSFDIACQCYMALNRLNDAAKLLFRHTDAPSLQLAAELAKKCDNKNLLDAILYKLSTTDSSNSGDSEIVKPLMSRVEMELKLAQLSNNLVGNSDAPECNSDNIDLVPISQTEEIVLNCDNSHQLD